MKNRNRPLHAIALLSILLALIPVASRLHAAPGGSSQAGSVSNLEYKMISGFKQPFNDDLQIHLSKGWTPVGGVGVTVWNNDLYFAQLLSRPAGQ